MTDRHIGRYALVRILARGGMADVWIGKVFGGGGFKKVVAIKILSPDKLDHETYQRALTDEAKITVALKHPNIVDLYDFNFEGDKPYLVMEYVEGTELRDLVRFARSKNIRFPLTAAFFIASEISKALGFAHDRIDPETGLALKIVHRDVSPSNILISTQGQVKLSDFGVAKSTLQSSVTQVGEIKGKFRYMSPEQAKGEALDHRSDIYSLGLVFYECLFGEPAYNRETDTQVFEAARTGKVSYPPDCDPYLKAILEKLLSVKVENRYSDLKDFRRDLGEYLVSHGKKMEQEEFRLYLEGLDIPQFKFAAMIHSEVADWNPLPSSQILEKTGTMRTIGDLEKEKAGWWNWRWTAGTVLSLSLTGMILFGYWKKQDANNTTPLASSAEPQPAALNEMASLKIQTIPADATIKATYGNKTLIQPGPLNLNDIPVGEMVDVTATKKGLQTVSKSIRLTEFAPNQEITLTLPEIKKLEVVFNAEPFAQVSFPGHAAQETPFTTSGLTPGNYDITFIHEPSGRRITATLTGGQGGRYRCFANMNISDAATPPSAICKPF